ncbi:hypothetical protein [Curtobacterium sp. UCD-KPL2560]|uniref:hypothetical protein n=1 Tax=Curtobacterium sp. UCD-KPL2560 TaxID=1885315 RepID=UPI001495DA5C|nr:hypothetical protein [Curtobacterium sp. UCD-KPL2560]
MSRSAASKQDATCVAAPAGLPEASRSWSDEAVRFPFFPAAATAPDWVHVLAPKP